MEIRLSPSAKGKIVGGSGKGIFTIVEVKNDWGRLKSGAGWIDLRSDSYVIETTLQGKKTIDQIAKEAIEGKWGNGSERKQRLEAAGYNYSEVQARVNKLLS